MEFQKELPALSGALCEALAILLWPHVGPTLGDSIHGVVCLCVPVLGDRTAFIKMLLIGE